MMNDRPSLAQALTADRIAFERARTQAEAIVPGLSDLSSRLRMGLGIMRLSTSRGEVLRKALSDGA